MQSEHDHDLAINKIRERFRRAFTFIRGFHALRTRVQSDVEKPPDQYIRLTQLPSHSCVYLTIQDNESASASEIESTTSEVLYVARSRAAKCPAPSERLHPYLLSGWDDARVATPTLELDDRKFPEDWNPCDENDLLSKFAAWREERQHWLHDEQERAKCNMLYERLYSWHHLIAFQPEVWEVVIGNGVLTYTPSQSDQSISTTDQLSETDNEEQSMVQNPELTSAIPGGRRWVGLFGVD